MKLDSKNLAGNLARQNSSISMLIMTIFSLGLAVAVLGGAVIYNMVHPKMAVCFEEAATGAMHCERAGLSALKARDADYVQTSKRFTECLYAWNPTRVEADVVACLNLSEEKFAIFLKEKLENEHFVASVKTKGVVGKLRFQRLEVTKRNLQGGVQMEVIFDVQYFALQQAEVRSEPVRLGVQIELIDTDRSVRWPHAVKVGGIREMHKSEFEGEKS